MQQDHQTTLVKTQEPTPLFYLVWPNRRGPVGWSANSFIFCTCWGSWGLCFPRCRGGFLRPCRRYHQHIGCQCKRGKMEWTNQNLLQVLAFICICMVFTLSFILINTQKKIVHALEAACHSVSMQLNELRDEWRRLHHLPADGQQPQAGQVGFFNDRYNFEMIVYLPGSGFKVND